MGLSDVVTLRRFVAAAKKENQSGTVLSPVDAVPRAVMDARLEDAAPYTFRITQQAALEAIDPDPNSPDGPLIPKALQPNPKRDPAIRRPVLGNTDRLADQQRFLL